MKTKLMALVLMAGGAIFAQPRFAIGVNIGTPAPVVVAAHPGRVWVDGYRDGYGRWTAGYWAAPPYAGAYWVAPRFYGGHFAAGYWGGPRHYEHGYVRGFRR